MMHWKILSRSPEETGRLGQALGRLSVPGTIIGLIGNLGAGKTRFVQGIAEGLEVNPLLVNSPTFTLIQEYEGRLPIAHFDTYRLRSEAEFLELGADEYLQGSGICLLEWADRVLGMLPPDRIDLQISLAGENERELDFCAGGPQSRQLLQALRDSWSQTEHPPHENPFPGQGSRGTAH